MEATTNIEYVIAFNVLNPEGLEKLIPIAFNSERLGRPLPIAFNPERLGGLLPIAF
jgi:hypothetical protein